MRVAQFSLERVMIWLGFAAINFAALRTLSLPGDLEYMIVGTIAWVLIQAGILFFLHDRPEHRAYWFGFAYGGMFVAISITSTLNIADSSEGWVWSRYYEVVETLATWAKFWLSDQTKNRGMIEFLVSSIRPVCWFIPLCLAAFVSGSLCRLVFKKWFVREPENNELPSDLSPHDRLVTVASKQTTEAPERHRASNDDRDPQSH